MTKKPKPISAPKWQPDRLRALLDECSMSVTQLAAMAGVSESTARTWLAGTSAPRSETVALIAGHFGVAMGEFFGRKR